MLYRGLLASIVTMFCGCQFTPQPTGLLEREASEAKLSSHQLRTMVNEFVVHFADRIELTADSILASSPDSQIRRNTLLWKINGISEAYQAGSRHDPLGAYLDLWILNRQMASMIDSEHGGRLLGEWQHLASQESHKLEDRLKDIQLSIGVETRFGQEFVAKFAADYPLTSLYFDREPIASRYIEEVREPVQDLYHVAVNLDENIDELRRLSVLFAEHLPKQARWEAELFLLDAAQLPIIDQPLRELSTATTAATALASTIGQLPDLVERERLALNSTLSSERLAAFGQIENMRLQTLKQLSHERGIVLDALTNERTALTLTIANERDTIMCDLDTKLEAAVSAMDAVTGLRIDEIMQRTPKLIDHFMWRVALLVFILLLVVAGTLLCRTVWIRKRGMTTPFQIYAGDSEPASAFVATTSESKAA